MLKLSSPNAHLAALGQTHSPPTGEVAGTTPLHSSGSTSDVHHRPIEGRYVPPEFEPALQDRLPMHCFGCGTLNAAGLQIKSRWIGNVFVCVWQPGVEHVGYPGCVYGGTIASVVDCHAVWAAFSFRCAEAGHDLANGPPPFVVVTAGLAVDYLRPAALTEALELRAVIVEHGARKTVVACSVMQGTMERATAKVTTVAVTGTL